MWKLREKERNRIKRTHKNKGGIYKKKKESKHISKEKLKKEMKIIKKFIEMKKRRLKKGGRIISVYRESEKKEIMNLKKKWK